MISTAAVLLISLVTFLFGAAGVAVFGPPLETGMQIGAIGWLVRGLVGLAVAHTCLGIYGMVERMRDYEGVPHALRAEALSSSLMSLIAFGGILLALAALLHMLDARRAAART
jgi:heme/copper-type cytochrome/quinol oxidase subunit 1